MQAASKSWRSWQKISFRFIFLLLGSTTFACWVMEVYFATSIFSHGESFGIFEITTPYKLFVKPFYWLDRYIFHTGYSPKIHEAFPEDNHFGVVFYLSLLLMALVGTIVWTLLDKKRSGYNRLLYWFRLYIRYILAMVMFGYGIIKFLPVQMTYPGVVELLTPLGESSRFSVLWNFMGIAPGYMILTGASEILASLLILNRRTLVFGNLLLLIILINVVALNIFYNIPVKMFSVQLLSYNLFLLAPYFYALAQFFLFGRPATLAEPHYHLQVKWKKLALLAIIVCIPLPNLLLKSIGAYERYKKSQANARRQRNYEVISFVAKDTLPPLLTDSLRWKRFLLAYTNYAVICSMQDVKDYYECDVDSIRETFTLHDGPDTLKWHVFHYAYPAKDRLALTGKWKGQDVQILMKSVPLDSVQINKEKIKWVTD